MSLESFIGSSIICAIALGIYGLVRGFPWFVIQGALVNGPGFIAALWAISAGITNGTGGNAGWWVLAAIGAMFALVCGFNLKNFLDGSEARHFYELVRREVEKLDDE